MTLTKEQIKLLRDALDKIGEVQVAMTLVDNKLPEEQRTESWRELYEIRRRLGWYVHNAERREKSKGG